MRTLERQAAALKALGRIEGFTAELNLLKSTLETVPLWRPAAGLARQCSESIRLIGGIAARLERRLVVTVIGPSGSGKSTLVNALAGGAALSPAGRQRPTTGRLVVCGGEGADAVDLGEILGGQGVEFQTAVGAGFPERLYLVDTPDTDSMALRSHIPALTRAIDHSDVLVCVFDAENPKRRDHADFLAPFVRRFTGESLVAVLNKCDRLAEQELTESILPDFRAYLQSAWAGAVDRAFCLSARRHVNVPAWDPEAEPRHGFDEFDQLRAFVFGAADGGAFVVDRRVDNAGRLHALVLDEAGRELASAGEPLQTARNRLLEAVRDARAAAAAALQGETRLSGGATVAICQKLSPRWVGPVGWVLALWTRLMTIGSGIASVLRPGRALTSAAGALTGMKAGREERGVVEGRLDAARRRFRVELFKRWPEVAELLVRGGFDPSVRGLHAVEAAGEQLAAQLSERWGEAVEAEVEQVTHRLASAWLQALLNAPVVGILGYVGWVTVRSFFRADYLPGDYFVHAFWVTAIALLLSFFALQVLIRLAAGPGRLMARAARRLQSSVPEMDGSAEIPARAQLEAVLRLAAAAATA